MNKLAKKAMRQATKIVSSIAGCRVHWLFSLVIVALMLTVNAAYAQGAGNVGKNGQTADPGPNQTSASDITKTYDKRFPFMAAQRKADTHTKTAPGTKNEESDDGSQHVTTAYEPVIKLCDTCHYGISYMQIPMIANNKTLQSRDDELFKNTLKTHGMPLSDTQFQVIQRENHQRFLEQLYDPEKMMWAGQATMQMQGAAAANSTAGTAEQSFGTALDRIVNADGGNCLINVANEASGAGFPGRVIEKTIPEAVGMVQTMYKHVFVPMAILFLLPGAVASQVKGQIGRGFNLGYNEAQSPFDGILRSIVAIFLIPATQVIVSWSIDTGNSMAISVRDWVDTDMIQEWAHQLSYNTNPQKDQNVVNKGSLISASGGTGQGTGAGGGAGGIGSTISGIGSSVGGVIGGWISSLGSYITASGGDGLGAQEPEGAAISERTGNLSQIMQLSLNTMMNMASIFLVVLGAYQIVMICYLFLLGPLAAAFYAWPQLGSTSMFRGIFGRWVEGVIQVSLWRFYWMVVLAVMTQRLIYTNGGTSDLQWEVCMFTCFLGILLWAPSSPFVFNPATGLASAEKIASDNKQDGGKGGGGGGGGGKGDDKGSVGASHGGDHHGKADGQTGQQGQQHEQVNATHNNQGDKEDKSHSPSNKAGDDKQNENKDKIGSAPPMNDQAAPNNASPVVSSPPPPGEKSSDAGGKDGDNKSAAPVVTASASVSQGQMPQGQAPVPLSGGSGGAKTSANPSVQGGSDGDKSSGDEGGKGAGGGAKGQSTVVAAGGGGGNSASASASASSSAQTTVQHAAGQVPSSESGPPKAKKDDDTNK